MSSVKSPRIQAPLPGPVSFSDDGLAFDDTPRTGEALMRRDEARLTAAQDDPRPTLLWYAWDRPTITLGRLQDPATAVDSLACAAAGIPVVRRPTGGRAVLHADEWTYGAIVPLDHPVLGGGLGASCRALVTLVTDALVEAYGIRFDPPGRGGEGLPAGPPAACFTRAFGYEAVAAGRKLMGSAQRRSGRVLLQQGSLLVGPGHERLARWLARPDPGAEAALARGAISLTELLGPRPDPGPFRRALERIWRERARAGARSA
jgi:lipoate-protein ligase A